MALRADGGSLERLVRRLIPSCAPELWRAGSLKVPTLAILIGLTACAWAGQAQADLSISHDAFLRGFNSFAQANAKPSRMRPKFTATSSVGLLGTTKIGKFVDDVDGCLLVTGISKGASQTIDTVFAANSACNQPGKLDELLLLARYLVSLSGDAAGRRTGEEMVVQAFKTAEKTHRQQTVAVGSLKFKIGLSSVIGWSMWVE